MITLAEYLAFRGFDQVPSSSSTAQLEFLIESAIADCERYCRRSFIKPTAAIAEVFSGDGKKDYYLRNSMIAASTTPTLAWWDGDSWVASTSVFTFDRETGRLWFTDGTVFTEGTDNWQVTYFYGYTTADDVPVDLKLSLLRYVQALHRLASGKEGLVSESFDGHTSTFSQTALTKEIKGVWEQYRSYGGN